MAADCRLNLDPFSLPRVAVFSCAPKQSIPRVGPKTKSRESADHDVSVEALEYQDEEVDTEEAEA